jgi:hypothetical protein
MNSTIYYKNIQILLFQFADIVAHSNSLGLSDQAMHAENLFCAFLNTAFGWQLVNTNETNKNQDSFDLFDKRSGIAIQVTSNKNYAAKLKKTVNSYVCMRNPPKIKHLIILFIARKCPPAILKNVNQRQFSYEGFDIPKLLSKVYYANKTSAKLQALNKILSDAILPVQVGGSFPLTYLRENGSALPLQKNERIADGIYIERKSLIENLFSFSQAANGIIVGGPGVGKSFTIKELQRYCNKRNIPCFLIKINELLEGSDAELQKELKASQYWINALKKTTPKNKDFKPLLIFDAFDAAKDGRLQSMILKQIRIAINELNGMWHILVSARIFDAAKSPQLQELFPQVDIRSTISCRFLEIPELSEAELNLLIRKDKRLNEAIPKCTSELLTLLRTPYFLKLLDKLLTSSDNVQKEELSHIKTEEQLLEIYWRKNITDSTEKDLFLRNLTDKLVACESLSCPKKNITELNPSAFDALLSLGIIVESSVTGQNITFNHNILLEFAVSKYLLPEDTVSLFKYIDEHHKIPFLFRQSFIYFYSKLWKLDKALFWKHYFQVRKNNTPLYRLYHQTILNYILAGYYQIEEDLSCIFQYQDTREKSEILRKFLESIRFIIKGVIRDKDYYLLLKISEHLSETLLWELGFLINKAIKQLSERADKQKMEAISKASLNYMSFVLERRKSAASKMLVDANGGYWGIQNICSILPLHKKQAAALIKKILPILKEEEFPIRFFHILADNIKSIFHTDAKLGVQVYKTIYNHPENSGKETMLGNSSVLTLRSNRRQDFHIVHYGLEKKYKDLLNEFSEDAILMGVEIADRYSINKRSYLSKSRKKVALALSINGVKAKMIPDFSYFESAYDKENGPMSLLENSFKYIEKLVDEKQERRARSLFYKILPHCQAAIVWKRLFRTLWGYPECFKKQALSILVNEEVYICNETVYEVGELIKKIWPHLSRIDRTNLEKTITSLPTSKWFIADKELATRRLQRLLGCISEEECVTIAFKRFVQENGVAGNEPLVRYSGLQPHDPSEEEQIRNMGVDPRDEEQKVAYELITQLEPFVTKYDFNNVDRPTRSDYEGLIPVVEKLFVFCRNQTRFNAKLQFNCDYVVSRFAKILSRNGSKLKKSERNMVESIAYFYLEHTSYKEQNYLIGDIQNAHGAYTPSPRTAAAQAYVLLLDTDKSGTIAPVVLQLMSDNTPAVRFKALNAISYYWYHNRSAFWEKINERIALEKDGLNLCRLIECLCFDNIISENQQEVEQIVILLWMNLKSVEEEPDINVWRIFVVLLLKLVLLYESKIGLRMIYENLDKNEFVRQLIFESTTVLDPYDQENNYSQSPDKWKVLIDILYAILIFQFTVLKEKNLRADNVLGYFDIIDHCVQHLYFITDHGRNENKGNKISEEQRLAFFSKIKPLLNLTVDESLKIESGFMVAHTGYYFMKLLNLMSGGDTRYVLNLSATIVQCSAANGFTYDHSTMREIVQLTEKILADHKELLYEKEHFNHLLTMLDLFSNSGWQEALELTWRLKEVF